MKMSDGSRLGQLLWEEDDPSGLCCGRMFWNQVKKKKKTKRESWREKKKRMRAAAGMFLNEGEKENKRRWGQRYDNVCGGEKQEKEKEKKEMQRMDEMK